MGLLGKMLDKVVPSMRMKEKVRGQARVVACDAYHGEGIYQSCNMQIVITADGVPPTSVNHYELVHRNKWPHPGMTLPLTIDPTDPTKFYVEWDEIPDSKQRAQQQADALAAAMRGPGVPAAMPPGGLHAGGMAIDPSLLQGHGPPMRPPQEAVADSDQEVDEQLARLAKLGQLRDAGVLTPAEFEQQKRRILEG